MKKKKTFNYDGTGKTSGGIPKIIHQIWVGGEIFGINKLYTESCKNMPGWEYRLWIDSDITDKNFPLTYKYIKRIINNPKRRAQISDLMRLEILYNNGGVYIDTTAECLKNLDDILNKEDYTFVVSNENDCGFDCNINGNYYISNSFIASTQYNEILKYMLSQLEHIDFNDDRIDKQTGPYFLGKYVRVLREQDKNMYKVIMLERKNIYPVEWKELDEYKEGEFDKCLSFEPKIGFEEFKKGDKPIYIKYPCSDYPDSYIIKHWYAGGSWLPDNLPSLPSFDSAYIANKNNLKCYIDTNFNKYNELSVKYNYTLKIAVLVNPSNGFGDIVFSVKFTKYLVHTFVNIIITYIIDTFSAKSFVEKLLVKYKNVNIIFCELDHKNNVLNSDIEIDCDILFITPKTSGKFNLKFKNEKNVLDNTYSFSEYNSNTTSTVDTGFGIEFSGLLLNNIYNIPYGYKKVFNTLYYSVCYFYLDDINLKKMILNSNIKFGKYTIEETSLKLFNIDIQELSKDVNKYREFLNSEQGKILKLLKFSLCYQEYLREISNITPLKNVNIFIKYENYEVIKNFINSLSVENIDFFNLSYIRDEINILNIKDLKPVQYLNFLMLLEYSLPVVFLTGDQSITDFITINKNFKYNIFYQIFEWKKLFAYNLTEERDYSICGKISSNILQQIKNKLIFDFRFVGLIIVQSTLIYALQYLLNKIVPSIKLCKTIDSSENLYDIIYNTDVRKKYKTSVLFTYLPEIYYEDEILYYKHKQILDLDFILGNLRKNNTIGWLPGSDVDELLLKYESGIQPKNILRYNCDMLSMKVEKQNILTSALHNLLIYSVIQNIYDSDNVLKKHLTKTYGNYILTKECNDDVKKRFVIPETATNYLNNLLIIDNFSGKYFNLKQLILNMATFKVDFNVIFNIFRQFIKIIRTLDTVYQIKYNNLNLEDIFIEQSNDPNDYLSYNIKLNNFSKSLFKINDILFYNQNYDEINNFELLICEEIINTNRTFFTDEKKLKLKTRIIDGKKKSRNISKKISGSKKRSKKSRNMKISGSKKRSRNMKISGSKKRSRNMKRSRSKKSRNSNKK